MKKICLAILTIATVGVFAKAQEEYVPCEKTYVDPFLVDLHEKTIQVETKGEVYQTSAIYSDGEGLFYQDYLNALREKALAIVAPATIIEELVVLTINDEEQSLLDTEIYSDKLILQEKKPQSTSQPRKALAKRPCWPYSNKMR